MYQAEPKDPFFNPVKAQQYEFKFEKELIQSGLEDNSKYNTQLSYQYTNAGMGGGLNWNRTHDVSTNEGGNYWW